MAPPTTSWLEDLATRIAATSVITAITDQQLTVRVLAHAKNLATQGKSNRIVLLPSTGQYKGRSDDETQIDEGELTVEAKIWGATDGWVDHLHSLLFQALDEQAAGDADDEDDAGAFYRRIDFEHPTTPDTALYGEALTVRFAIRIDILTAAATRGLVEDYQLTRG